jgi:tetratricopeptide (TPR) repeat protein
LSPIQAQIRLGCLKGLATLYSSGFTQNLTSAIYKYEEIVELEPGNVNNWYRYGKVALEDENLELAFQCFQRALACQPGHWGSLEKLITISYALHDLYSCLYYSARGLTKDPTFTKGLVFRDFIFENNPWVKDSIKLKPRGYESLFLERTKNASCDESTKKLYLDEARRLIQDCRRQNKFFRVAHQKDRDSVLVCFLKLKAASFLELCRTIGMLVDMVKVSGVSLGYTRVFNYFCKLQE